MGSLSIDVLEFLQPTPIKVVTSRMLKANTLAANVYRQLSVDIMTPINDVIMSTIECPIIN
jgi:hypothetical protein